MVRQKIEELPMNIENLIRLAPVVAGIRAYHRHSTVGMDQLPKSGMILAANHSLASYDIVLLMADIYEQTNRIPRALIDRLFFKVPGLGSLMESLGSREGTHENAVSMLKSGEILVVAPGGMREALRPSREKYKVMWGRRRGFARLAIETGCPIVLAACPSSDDLYNIAPSYVTVWAYKTLKIPLFFAKGIGFSPIPKPVKLTHYLSEPLYPPKKSEDAEEMAKITAEFHRRVVDRMERLMAEAAEKSKQ
jgi:1-acyl-sn-glycerol-3-phosphate acyltransferase